MKIIITTIICVALLLIASEINRYTYAYIFHPLVIPDNPSYMHNSEIPYVIMSAIQLVLFTILGFLLSFRIKDISLIFLATISLGLFYIAIELSLGFPWFFKMTSHPNYHSAITTFVSTLSAPIGSIFGAYIYYYVKIKPNN